jgi:apolipoprotein D and lipocalin family protein
MLKSFAVAALGLTSVSAVSRTWATNTSTHLGLGVDTVDELDVNAYVGTWYQMYADQLVYSTIEPNAYCVTAKYALLEDGSISVHNYQTTGSPSEGVDTIDGTATVPNPEEPGQLSVSFDSVDGGAGAPYWVLDLGPINADGLYDWSIVSDPFTAYLFVLARDVDTFNTKYDEEVNAKLETLGFTKKFNSPIATYQEDDCVYEA